MLNTSEGFLFMISITEAAANKIKHHLNKRGRGLGIRIGVKSSGCSGLSYVLEFVDESKIEDIKIENNQCTIFIDPKSQIFLQGMTIDYKKQGLNEGFEFVNPNEQGRCGCGSSFTV